MSAPVFPSSNGTADALDLIWDIVHTPTKATSHRSADRHFMADFDAIRQIIKDARGVAQGWQDISTAPKNGEPVLIYVPINTSDRRVLSAYWTDAGWWICSGSIVLGKPTLWMPMPTPAVPSTDHEGGK